MKSKIHQYTLEQDRFIRENHKGISVKDLVIKFNKQFGTDLQYGQMRSYMSARKLKNGINTKFKKGQVVDNGHRFTPDDTRGIPYRFKKGHKSHNTMPIGTELMRNGYILVKVRMPNEWKYKHHMIWEEVNGPVLPKHVLIFLDNDKNNIVIDNLSMISRAQLGVINRLGLKFENKESTEVGVVISDLIIKQAKMKKKIEKEEKENVSTCED